jgi:nucleoside-diphosphate-sugar epimerase
MIRALVTGGSGYIGSELAACLSRMGLLVDIPDYRLPDEVDRFDTNYDFVFHLASTVHSYHVLADEDWDLDARVNILGTQRLLHHFKDSDARFVYISTFFVNDGDPRCTYATSKLAAEHYCRAYARIFDMKTSIIRLPNIFGPGEFGSCQKGSLNWLVELLVRGEEAPLYDDDYIREFLYIDDAVRTICVHGMQDLPNGCVEDIPGEPMFVHKYLRLAWKLTGYTGSIRLVRTPDFHLRIGPRDYQTKLDPEIFAAYTRETSIEEGLRKLIAFFRQTKAD